MSMLYSHIKLDCGQLTCSYKVAELRSSAFSFSLHEHRTIL